jgi:hypothetical protein
MRSDQIILTLIAIVVAIGTQPVLKRPILSARTAVEALVITAVLLVVNLIVRIGAQSYRCDDYFCGWMR